MGLPGNIEQILHENMYYIVLGQNREIGMDKSIPPIASFISVFQKGRYLGKVLYECETKLTKVEIADKDTAINQQFLDYLKTALEEVGQLVWMDKVGHKPIYPEPLEALFQLGRKYFQ